MKNVFLYALFLFLLILTTSLLASLQTTLWYGLFGNLPGPMLWLLPITFINLYRPAREAIWIDYMLGFLISYFGWNPVGLIFLNLLCLFCVTLLVKHRFFWAGPGYFAMAGGVCAGLYHGFAIINSMIFESITIRELGFFDRFIQVLLTPLLAIPVFYLLKYLEKWTGQTPSIESTEVLL